MPTAVRLLGLAARWFLSVAWLASKTRTALRAAATRRVFAALRPRPGRLALRMPNAIAAGAYRRPARAIPTAFAERLVNRLRIASPWLVWKSLGGRNPVCRSASATPNAGRPTCAWAWARTGALAFHTARRPRIARWWGLAIRGWAFVQVRCRVAKMARLARATRIVRVTAPRSLRVARLAASASPFVRPPGSLARARTKPAPG